MNTITLKINRFTHNDEPSEAIIELTEAQALEKIQELDFDAKDIKILEITAIMVERKSSICNRYRINPNTSVYNQQTDGSGYQFQVEFLIEYKWTLDEETEYDRLIIEVDADFN